RSRRQVNDAAGDRRGRASDPRRQRISPEENRLMRLALIGQQAFGRAALDKFRERGDTVAGVFVAPEKPGSKPDPLPARAEQLGIPVFQFQRYGSEEALGTLRGLAVDIGIMAYVTQFVPQAFV